MLKIFADNEKLECFIFIDYKDVFFLTVKSNLLSPLNINYLLPDY